MNADPPPAPADRRAPPVVLLTFANDRHQPELGYLRDLVAERRALQATFEADAEQRRYRVVIEQNLTRERLTQLIERHGPDIVGFHYGGHAGLAGLGIEDARGRLAPITAADVGDLLATLPRLSWICLNGCTTRDHVAALHTRLDVPIIATTDDIRDDVARDFAAAFYRHLADGATLAVAYDNTRDALERGESPALVCRMLQPAICEASPWPWALHTHPGRPLSADWSLTGALSTYGLTGRLAPTTPPPLPRHPPPSLLLAPERRLMPFWGRDAELADLDRWADDPAPVRVRLIHGPGGAGKTRLLIEWLARRAAAGPIGFLPGPIDDDTRELVAEAPEATIVIDYAGARAGLRPLLTRLAERWRRGEAGRLRLVLLARNAGEWFMALRRRDPAIDSLLSDSPTPLALPPLLRGPARATEFIRAHALYAAYRRRAPDATAAPTDGDATDRALDEIRDAILDHPHYAHPLYVHLAAIAAVDGRATSTAALFATLRNDEERVWIELAGLTDAPYDDVTAFIRPARAFVAALALRGGAPDRPTAEALAARFTDDAPHLVRLMRTLYPAEQSWIAPVTPTLVGEAFILALLDTPAEPHWVREATWGASYAEMTRVFATLGRLEAHVPLNHTYADLLADDFDTRGLAALDALRALGHAAFDSRLGPALAARALATGQLAFARVLADILVPDASPTPRR